MTQRIYLIRHAPALTRDPARWVDDSERPLGRDGRRWFARVAIGIDRTVAAPDVVFSSPWLRAWATAELLEAVGWPSPRVLAALVPGGDPGDIASALPAEASRVAFVGHEPDLGRIASLLLTGDADRLRLQVKKGGLIAIDRDRDRGAATLAGHVPPRLFRRLA
jgi:phosphohistidine phosphatase